jgi:hypothetical protein
VAFETRSALSRIGSIAFALCSSLSVICIPSSVQVLSERCFVKCEALLSVGFDVPSNLSCIHKHAFLSCSSLASICVPSSVT